MHIIIYTTSKEDDKRIMNAQKLIQSKCISIFANMFHWLIWSYNVFSNSFA